MKTERTGKAVSISYTERTLAGVTLKRRGECAQSAECRDRGQALPERGRQCTSIFLKSKSATDAERDVTARIVFQVIAREAACDGELRIEKVEPRKGAGTTGIVFLVA